MLTPVIRMLVALSLVVAAACAPAATTPGASTTPTGSAAPSPTASPSQAASPSPAASRSPVPLPSTALLSAPSGAVTWILVGGTRLFRSSDSGATWQERELPAAVVRDTSPIASMTFVSDREGWVLSAGQPATQCQQQAFDLWHTADAGGSWTTVEASGIAFAQCKRLVAFADAQRGVLVAADSSTAPTVYRTADGGRTWSSTTLPAPAGAVMSGGVDAPQVTQVRWSGTTALLEALSFANPATHHVYRSTDSGATWTALTSIQQEGALALVTATRWLQIAPPASSKETTDAGATWRAFTTDYQQAAPIAPQIVFGDANVGFATVRGGLNRTIDGGAHWTSVRTPGT